MNCPGCPDCPGNALTCTFAPIEPRHHPSGTCPGCPGNTLESCGEHDMNPLSNLTPRWTVDDVANYLGVPVKTIYKWRLTGQGPVAVRIGKHLRYDPADVVAWFESQKIAS